jgi:hypothetical protein
MDISGSENPEPIKIPETMAELSQAEEAPEAEPFYISFARYNDKECQMDGMEPKMAKKTLRAIRDIGVRICDPSDFGSKLPKLEVKSILPSGEYKNLYKNLSDIIDLEIKEAKVDKNKGRLFFFIVDNVLYIIAAREAHYTTR